MINTTSFTHLSTHLIVAEAKRRGIKAKKLITKGEYSLSSLVEFVWEGQVEYMVGQRISESDSVAYWIQKNKYYTKLFFKRAGVSVSPGEVFKASDTAEVVAYAKKIGYPLVVKKIMGTHGDDVYVNVRTADELKEKLKKFPGNVLIEKMFIGSEYRLFATKERFVAATRRIPANVVGDGLKTIKELVLQKNADPRRSDGYTTPLVAIKLDEETDSTLSKQKRKLTDIPKLGEQIFLRENSNLSTGGDSIDVTDEVHPEVKELAVKTVKAIPGLAYAGIDFLTSRDISKAPSKNSYVIIEVNDSPMISMHHYPYEGKTRDAAGAIVDMLFPTSKGR